MKNKPNDFWLWIILLSFIPIVLFGIFVGSWLQSMTLWDRAKIIIPITLILIFLATKRK
jgi:hypothetical protein